MSARIVFYATIHDPRNGAWHREQPLGIPACGVPLRRPHRAIAIDATSEQLCASCWPVEVKTGDLSSVVSSDIHRIHAANRVSLWTIPHQMSGDLGRIETTPASAATLTRGLTTQPAYTGDEMATSHRNAQRHREAT